MSFNIKKINLEYILDITSTALISVLLMMFLSSLGLQLLFLPIPFIIIGMKYNIKEYFISILLTIALSLFIVNIEILLLNIIFTSIISFSILQMFRKNINLEKTILIVASIVFTVSILSLLIFYFYTKVNPIEFIKNALISGVDGVTNILKNDINISSKDLTDYIVGIKELIAITISVLPALLVISSLVIASTNILSSKSLMSKLGIINDKKLKINSINIVKRYRPMVMALALTIVSLYFIKIPNGDLLIENFNLILYFILFINGILILDYLLEIRFKKIVRIALFILFVVIFSSFSLLALLGAIDGILDLRNSVKIRDRHE